MQLAGQSSPPPEKPPAPATPAVAAPLDDTLEPPPALPERTPSSAVPEPLSLAPPPPPEPAAELGPRESASEIIRAILGLTSLFALAYLGGHRKVQQIEKRLRISHLVTAGLPFVILGAVAHLPSVGILSDAMLWQIRPLLPIGLGWIGFTVGFRFDARLVESLAPGMGTFGILSAALPAAIIIGFCGILLVATEGSWRSAVFLRDALILGTAGAMTARSAPVLLQTRGVADGAVDRVWSIVQVEQLAGVVGLMLTAAYFRPQGAAVAWQLPGTAWLFITLGMGTTIGGVIYATLGKVKRGPEFSLLILGSVAFTAGIASFLRLSPLVVCFIAAVILANLPGHSREPVRKALLGLERPIYLLFLVIAGSLWKLSAWQGWALMGLFVLARLVGKWLAVSVWRRGTLNDLGTEEKRSLVFSPLGALSIAIIISAQDLYFSATVSWMLTAVIGGAIVTELIVQMSHRPRPGVQGGAEESERSGQPAEAVL
jgi:hypothetical protein